MSCIGVGTICEVEKLWNLCEKHWYNLEFVWWIVLVELLQRLSFSRTLAYITHSSTYLMNMGRISVNHWLDAPVFFWNLQQCLFLKSVKTVALPLDMNHKTVVIGGIK